MTRSVLLVSGVLRETHGSRNLVAAKELKQSSENKETLLFTLSTMVT